jgi:hypothetical protein
MRHNTKFSSNHPEDRSRRGRSSNRTLNLMGMSSVRHDIEILNALAKRAGNRPPSFIVCVCGCGDLACAFIRQSPS